MIICFNRLNKKKSFLTFLDMQHYVANEELKLLQINSICDNVNLLYFPFVEPRLILFKEKKSDRIILNE